MPLVFLILLLALTMNWWNGFRMWEWRLVGYSEQHGREESRDWMAFDEPLRILLSSKGNSYRLDGIGSVYTCGQRKCQWFLLWGLLFHYRRWYQMQLLCTLWVIMHTFECWWVNPLERLNGLEHDSRFFGLLWLLK